MGIFPILGGGVWPIPTCLCLFTKFFFGMPKSSWGAKKHILLFWIFCFGTSSENNGISSKKFPYWGRGGGLPTWELFPHNPVFCFWRRPLVFFMFFFAPSPYGNNNTKTSVTLFFFDNAPPFLRIQAPRATFETLLMDVKALETKRETCFLWS